MMALSKLPTPSCDVLKMAKKSGVASIANSDSISRHSVLKYCRSAIVVAERAQDSHTKYHKFHWIVPCCKN